MILFHFLPSMLLGQHLTAIGSTSMNGKFFKLYSLGDTFSRNLIDSSKMQNNILKFDLITDRNDYYILAIEGENRFLSFIGNKNSLIKIDSINIDQSVVENSPENDKYLKFNRDYHAKFTYIMKPIYVKIEEAKRKSDLSDLQYWQKKKREAYNELMELVIIFITKNTDSFVSLLLLEKYWSELQYKDLLKLLSGSFDDHYRYIQLFQLEKNILNKKEAKLLPTFVIRDIYGKIINTKDFKNKILFIDFWGTWCVPCLELIPEIIDLHVKYNDNSSVVFLSVAYESNDDIERFRRIISKFKLQGTHVLDPQNESTITKQLGINTFPTFIIIDQKNKTVFRDSGSQMWSEAVQKLEKLTKALK